MYLTYIDDLHLAFGDIINPVLQNLEDTFRRAETWLSSLSFSLSILVKERDRHHNTNFSLFSCSIHKDSLPKHNSKNYVTLSPKKHEPQLHMKWPLATYVSVYILLYRLKARFQ
jgi:hypothetical protein